MNTAFMINGYHSIETDICLLNSWYDYFFNTAVELAVNRFKWENLPEEIDERYLELKLLTNTGVIFFHDYYKGFCALPGTWTGFDYQMNPLDFHVVTPTGFAPTVSLEEGVMIWNNSTRVNDMYVLCTYAKSVAEIYQTALINVNGQKHPIVVLADSESQKLTMENAYAKLSGNHPVIYVKGANKGIVDNFKTIDAQVPFIAPQLFETARSLWDEFLKWLGVRVPNQIKKERQIQQEVKDTNAVTYQLRNRGLKSRETAIKEINKKFGINLKVEFNEESIEEYYPGIMKNQMEEEDFNE